MKTALTTLAIAFCSTTLLHAVDWPQWGGRNARNMVSEEKGLPIDFFPGKKKSGTEEVDVSTTKNCAWVVKLGSQSYGTPTISGGRVFVGTNNESPRNPKIIGDRGVLMCFDEYTGKFLWQLACPKMGSGKVNDWEYLGICSAPTVIGDRAYVPTNRCQIVCLNTEGMAKGKTGSFTVQDEANFMAAPGPDGKLVPVQPGPQDADIQWVFDMYKELGVFQHNATSGYPLVVGDKVFTTTCNGVDWTHANIPAPNAPSFIMLDAKTGQLLGEMDHIASERVLHCSWSSPIEVKAAGKDQIVFAAGDGWIYSMLAETHKSPDGQFDYLKENWRYDCNPPEYRKDAQGNKRKYAEFDGPSECIATPVFYDGLIYMGIGQDPEHGEGLGMLSCIDPTQSGDLSGKAKWTFKGIERSLSTCAIKDGLLYTCDYTGRVFCMDCKTGKEIWKYDTKGHIWASPMLVDGKIYIGNEEGELFILKEGREMKEIAKIDFPAPIKGTIVAANGALYVTTETHLYCFKEGAKPVQE